MEDIVFTNLTPSLITVTGNALTRNTTSGLGRAISNQTRAGSGIIECKYDNQSGASAQMGFGLTASSNPQSEANFPYYMRITAGATTGNVIFIFEGGIVVGADKYVDSDDFDESSVFRIVIEDLTVMYQYSLDAGVSFQVCYTSKIPFDMSTWRFGALMLYRETEFNTCRIST